MKRNNEFCTPRWPLRFLRYFVKPEYLEEIEGDMEEIHHDNIKLYSETKARRLYLLETLKLFRPIIIKNLEGTQQLTQYGMLKNYFTTAIRNIQKEKLYAAMNIAGLALGIGCALVIYKVLSHELSFDKHHSKYDHIYRLVNVENELDANEQWAGQVHPLGQAIRNDFPTVDAAMTFNTQGGLVNVIDQKGNLSRFKEKSGIAFVEPTFFNLFDYEFIIGNPASALANNGSVILTSRLAQKYFNLSVTHINEALGRSLNLDSKLDLTVTGIVENIPTTTDLPFEMIMKYEDQEQINPYYNNGTDWNEYNSKTNCYILMANGAPPLDAAQQLEPFIRKYRGEEQAQKMAYALQPLASMHTSDTVTELYTGKPVSSGKWIILGAIGLFLIITASINFINLSTAQAVKRGKEVGVRKALGSSKTQLVLQFLGETILITLVAALIGLVIAKLLLLALANVIGYSLDLDLIADPRNLVFLLGLTCLVGLLSGLYPAIFMSKMKPVSAIKYSFSAKKSNGIYSLRRGLVVFQFAISQILIIGTVVIYLQMEYFLNKDLGFNKDSILITELPDHDLEKIDVLKNKLNKHTSITLVSHGTKGPLADWRSINELNHPAIEKDKYAANLKTADENYIDLYQLQLVAGRNYTSDENGTNVVVNRKLTKVLGFEDPQEALGEKIMYGRWNAEYTIIGVVEDFHTASLHQSQDPVILANRPFNIFELGIKIDSNNTNYTAIQEVIKFVSEQWTNTYPDHVFEYVFYDQKLKSFYKNEERTSKLFQLFGLISIFIGCIGLYGLVSYMANKKTKEIGIRKVFGASVWNILKIFSMEMTMLLLIAFAFAGPIGYYTMNLWLQDFAYSIKFSPIIFVIAIVVSLVIALATISYKSIFASLVNPINSLKDE